jgi:hypothetical protein
VACEQYTFQALAINEFQGTPYEASIIRGELELTHPGTVWRNLECLAAFVPILGVMALTALSFLYRERR